MGLDALDVDRRNAARLGADDKQSARERRIGDVIVNRRVASFERFFENLPRAILEVGRISIARHKDVARNEALEDITTREERDAMPFLQQQNSARDVEEIGIGDLEKFVARKCLEDFDERLAIVTARIE